MAGDKNLHKLFDLGYVTVTLNLRLEVSPRLKVEWENGKEYYADHGAPLPADAANRPARPPRPPVPAAHGDVARTQECDMAHICAGEFLMWHKEKRFQT
jgi:hypothetical protein